jgi:hypothetical protein
LSFHMADVLALGAELAPPDVGPEDLVYLEKVRLATKRLAYRAPAPDDLVGALQSLRDVSQFDIEAPTAANRREVELLKSGVKRLLAWYMRYLAVQLNNFSAATARVGEVLAGRVEGLEKGTGELEARVGALEARVGALEERARRTEGARPASRSSAPARKDSGPR